jgi:hypothetical protein
MNTNIPTVNLKDIISSMLEKKKSIVIKFCMRISFNIETGNTYTPMDASTSCIFSEIYLQYMENITIGDILIQQQI